MDTEIIEQAKLKLFRVACQYAASVVISNKVEETISKEILKDWIVKSEKLLLSGAVDYFNTVCDQATQEGVVVNTEQMARDLQKDLI